MVRWLAVGVVGGAWAFPYLQPPALHCGVAGLLLAFLAWWPGARPLALLASGLAFGMGAVARLEPGPELLGEVRLRGVVVTSPEGRSADVQVVATGGPTGPVVPAAGRVRVLFPGPPPAPGVGVVLAGRARRVDGTRLPGERDPVVSAARAGVRSVVVASSVVRVGRDRAPPDFEGAHNAALLRALVDGTAGEIPGDDATLLRRTGTWHLVSISGLHVGIGALLGWWAAWLCTRPLVALRWRGLRWLHALGGILGAWVYADVADWGVPARRAATMATVACVAVAAHRRPDPLRTLGLSAVAVVASEPTAVGTLGFSLSFGAMLGMILVSGRVDRLVPPDLPAWARWAAKGLAASAGATVGTLPVVALSFQSLSWASPVANLWAIPWIGSVATPASLVAAVSEGLPHDLALVLADAACTVGLWGLRGLDAEPWAPAVGVAGAVLLGATGLLWRREVLALVATLSILGFRAAPRQELVVRFLAVGQGDAALVEWPDGRRWLVDGGPPGNDLLHDLRRRGITRLDTVFVSHGHPDHYGGLVPVLAALRVDRLVARGLVAELAPFASRWTSRHPSLVDLPSDYEAKDENDRSLVLRFGLGEHRFLFPGDAEWAQEQALVATRCAALPATVLKVAHHGSRTSSSAPFLACVHPELAVVSAGFDNRYGHPHGSVLRTLWTASFRPEVWVTAQRGTLVVRTDGTRLRTAAEGAPARWRLR